MPEKALFYLGRDLPLKLGIILPKGLTDSCSDFFLLHSLLQTRQIYLQKNTALVGVLYCYEPFIGSLLATE